MEPNSSTQAKPKKKTIRKIIGGILLGIVISLLGLQIIGQISGSRNYGVPKYGSYQSFRVLTDSMEPTYNVNTMLFVKEVEIASLKGPSAEGANDGDVITFVRNYGPSYTIPGDKLIITHRIIKIEPQEDGSIYFRTLGDNLNAKTCGASGCTLANADYVRDTDILGKVVGQSVFLGHVSAALANPVVMVGLIAVPLLFLFAASIVDLVRDIKAVSKEPDGSLNYDEEFERIKQEEKLKLLIELEKEKMREQLAKGEKEDGQK